MVQTVWQLLWVGWSNHIWYSLLIFLHNKTHKTEWRKSVVYKTSLLSVGLIRWFKLYDSCYICYSLLILKTHKTEWRKSVVINSVMSVFVHYINPIGTRTPHKLSLYRHSLTWSMCIIVIQHVNGCLTYHTPIEKDSIMKHSNQNLKPLMLQNDLFLWNQYH